jgi:hypothetical protein
VKNWIFGNWVREHTPSEFDGFTMRAFPEYLSGPSDIRVRAPGKS